ncbi:MAG: hypothetical protein IJ567_06715 [Lachnospiraceae bacterium]|nr:hypothetical protein [Lachnospiraceae bacterium]
MKKEKQEQKKTEGRPKKKEKLPRKSFLSRFDWLNRFRHWWLGAVSIHRSLFRVTAAWQTLGILIAILVVGYIMAAIYTQSGEFIISLDRKMADDGFILSETTDFSQELITLYGTAVVEANNISIYDIDRNVMNVDGDHNGVDYVAYTFYIKNNTEEIHDYHYQLMIRDKSKGVENAAWVMLFKEGEQGIYAMIGADGEPESQKSDVEFPFMEYASDEMKAAQVESKDGEYTLTTIPFVAKDMVCTGMREDIEPGEYDKYTAVIWAEGEDPECVDAIIGGYIELTMKFIY